MKSDKIILYLALAAGAYWFYQQYQAQQQAAQTAAQTQLLGSGTANLLQGVLGGFSML